MKNKITFFVIIFLSVLFVLPFKVNAVSTPYTEIDKNIESIEESGLSFTNLSYDKQDNSSDSSLIGIIGTVSNNNDYGITYKTKITFYDINYKVVATANDEKAIEENGTSTYSKYINLQNIDEIAYYQFEVETVTTSAISSKQKPSEDSYYEKYQYVIDEYNVKVKVNENNTYDVVENITVNYRNKQEFVRTIPLKTKLGKTFLVNNIITITNLKVDNEYKVSKENDMYKITLGSNNNQTNGEQKYKIEYRYNAGKDPYSNVDEFEYSIISNEWNTAIGNVSFQIEMPKDFNTKKIKFSTGHQELDENSKLSYSVDDTIITGYLSRILEENEHLTIRIELPEGYYVGTHNNFDNTILTYILIPILLLIISTLLWYKFGKTNHIDITDEPYPPSDCNSAEMSFIYKATVNNKDIISLLLYLANKGYIKIVETDRKEEYSNNNVYEIVKLKEYDGNNNNEKMFMDGLFKESKITKWPTYTIFNIITNNPEEEIINKKDVITRHDFRNTFFITLRKIIKNINGIDNIEKLFIKNSMKIRTLMQVIIIFTIVYTWAIPIILFNNSIGLALDITGLFMFCPFYINNKYNNKRNFRIILCIVSILLLPSIYLLIIESEAESHLLYIVGRICTIIMNMLYLKMPKRTDYGKELLGKVIGFKNFIQKCDKEQLEQLVNQNPSYFYEVLPYAYALELSDKWFKKIRSIPLPPPSWYEKNTPSNSVSFEYFFNKTMESVTEAMTSTPSK